MAICSLFRQNAFLDSLISGENDNGRANTMNFLIATFLLTAWSGCSVMSTLTNKMIIDTFNYPVTLSIIQLISSAIVDFYFLMQRRRPLLPIQADLIWLALPVAASINCAKSLTYVSYGSVPASLTHTAKAAQPVFSVGIMRLLTDEQPSIGVLLTLLPTTIGVTLAAVTEINFEFVGFIAALLSSIASVLNTIFSKRAMNHSSCKDPLLFHFYSCMVAVCMALPYALIFESTAIWKEWHSPVDLVDVSFYENTLQSRLTAHFVPMFGILFSTFCHYGQNLSSIYFLYRVSVLSYQVANSFKRLVVIFFTVLYFGNQINILNGLGILLAMIGVLAYSVVKGQSNRTLSTQPGLVVSKMQPSSESHCRSRSTSFGLHHRVNIESPVQGSCSSPIQPLHIQIADVSDDKQVINHSDVRIS